MTESASDAATEDLFARIREMVTARKAGIRLQQDGNALRLEFTGGQRILLNLDPQTRHVWLAAASGGSEFIPQGTHWVSAQHGELFARLQALLEQTIVSDPRNAQEPAPSAPATVILHTEPREGVHLLRNVLLLLLAGLLGYWLAQRPAPVTPPDQDTDLTMTALPAAADGGPCENILPDNGSTTLFPESGLRPGDTGTELTLNNEHAHPLLLILTAPRSAVPALSVLLHARQRASIRVPPGQYDLMFSAGTRWCDARSGFADGRMLKMGEPLSVRHDTPMRISLQSAGAGPEDFRALISTFVAATPPPAPSFSGDGSMTIRRHDNGHFYVPGTVSDIPVTFMLDTGASVTSITAEIARQAGVHNCKEIQVQTANGTASGCLALVPQMTLGNFTLKNITVAVMPNMETNLLGANVLRNFRVGQDGDLLLIGRE
jgi:clan AA aspartic protease (TIGR02281 family)